MMNHGAVVNDIEAMLEGAEPPVSDECCIYRVPFGIRRLKEDAYTPEVVSIGPFHHKTDPRFQNMEKLKLIYCKAFLERTQTTYDAWISYIEGVESDFRRYYSDSLEFSKVELVKMIFVDSGFIFELFWRSYYRRSSRDATFLLTPWLTEAIYLDLLLLENQLPFLVLDALFKKSFPSTSAGGNNKIPSFIQLTFAYFNSFNRSELSFSNNISIRHFTDLIRTFHLQHPPERRSPRTEELVNHLPSATELTEAGVSFKENTGSHCLLDLNFSGRVLEIPQLVVEDGTEVLFRNMVALEQCLYPDESYITDYVDFLDFLVNTSKDVDILVREEVLVNWLGDTDSVANMFNGLMKNITQLNASSHYLQLCQDLNAFCRDPLHKLKSTLRRDYCHSPWKTAASIAGILLLILTLLQSVCSVLQVIQQSASPSPKRPGVVTD